MVQARDGQSLQRRDDGPGGAPGKLTEAARALAYLWTGRADPGAAAAIDDEVRRQFAALGQAPPPADEPAAPTIEVWDVNWTSFALFRSCGSQWRVVATGHALVYLGLDYPGVDVVIRRLAPPDADPAALMADLMACEAAALPVLNEERS